MPLRAFLSTTGLALAFLAFAEAVPARGAPVEDGGRIAVQAGWHYTLNGRFAELAGAAGHPLDRPSAGGPAVMAVFAYRPTLELEISLEFGYSHERFAFRDTALELTTLPVAVAARYALVVGPITPYLGGGVGYFLNFVSASPVGSLESHGAGPMVIAGASFDVGERIALVAEYRIAFARVSIPGLAPLQTGGNWFLLGAQISFAPEEKRLP
jgi:opacity protein-like surface antigen